ncbi:hypothetical protein HLRTI_001632 [Halorhabdus tiamatea SARL4B]|uniref:Uncharacterized protein n=1 Tax=Halorhabdus tiamatea SARL4B TaxID=1033806 RepID=F7PG49_9EURY|nr:hypothetical protein [Halorhabdus tiamatea]ERJ06287.1 hypothetical protein HLRTI_001632 [Halorhabdus tiamatea SARL4B]CCQ34660.1 conserved hypothetical protein [Halorhabdus tiamatea SARL4B]
MKTTLPRRLAGWLAERDPIPTTGQAVLSYYADSGVFDRESIQLKRIVDQRTEAMIEDAFGPVETAIAADFDVDPAEVAFSYDTKLTMPAELTLGQIYRTARRRADDGADPVALSMWADGVPDDDLAENDAAGPVSFRRAITDEQWQTGPSSPQDLVDGGDYLTRLVLAALIDGDMRDAINDAEFDDFAVGFEVTPEERRRVAEIAQETLASELEATFERLPADVRNIYEWAVDLSERHQDRDPHFRDLFEAARDGDQAAREQIRTEYRDASLSAFDTEITLFEDVETLPYLKTQYARVGVIYDGMIEMYRRAGLPVDEAFKRSIVLAIIGAQIWLDDLDDYADDRLEGQLTPVTAEYVLADDPTTAYNQVVAISEQYFDLAEQFATETDSPLTGIATEYIYRSGDPGVLPGAAATDSA